VFAPYGAADDALVFRGLHVLETSGRDIPAGSLWQRVDLCLPDRGRAAAANENRA